jgi:hypothetical protein
MGVWERMKQLLGQSFHTSREVLARARDKAQELGEVGLLRYEISRLEKQAQKLFGRLGTEVFDRLTVRGEPSVSGEALQEHMGELQEIRRSIRQKEADLQALR